MSGMSGMSGPLLEVADLGKRFGADS